MEKCILPGSVLRCQLTSGLPVFSLIIARDASSLYLQQPAASYGLARNRGGVSSRCPLGLSRHVLCNLSSCYAQEVEGRRVPRE